MRRLTAVVWCLTLLILARPADCTQGPRRVNPGARIRFDVPSLVFRQTGTLVRWEDDTLVVSVDGDAPGLALMVPVDSVTQLEVYHERRLTAEGLLLGGLAGTVLAVIADPDIVDENGDCTTIECVAYQVSPHAETRIAVLAGVGALLGTIIGSQTKTARWVHVPLEHLTVGGTQDGGLALGVRISF
jgi:hypothetical protein